MNSILFHITFFIFKMGVRVARPFVTKVGMMRAVDELTTPKQK